MEITERQAVEADENWIWLLYVNLLKGVVTAQWGWDETFQVDMFSSPFKNYPPLRTPRIWST